MQKMDIDKISVAGNPRTDFGDLTELTASIKEKGILQPLLVRKTESGAELIAGERRLRAAKASGLKQVPVAFSEGHDEQGIEEIKLIENIQRKDLNPAEEGKAFKSWMDKTKKGVETLAQKISKPKLYVERRLELLKLDPIVRTAMREGKITLSHGVLLAKLKPTDQKQHLKAVIRDKKSVSQLEHRLRYGENSAELKNAKFDRKDCLGCQFNGGEQALLIDSGSDIKGRCLNTKCFHEKEQAWVKEESEKLKNDGIAVFTEKQLEKKYPKAKLVSEYDNDYKEVKKRLKKETEVFAIVFDKNWQGIQKKIYCINPARRYPKKAKSQEPAKEELKLKSQNAQEKLIRKVERFKREFLLNKLPGFLKVGERNVKALAVFSMIQNEMNSYQSNFADEADKLIRQIGNDEVKAINKLISMTDAELNKLMLKCASWRFDNENNEFLCNSTKVYGLQMEREFAITKEYLEMHTKDQLINLTKELKLNADLIGLSKMKKTELMDKILEYDLKGKIPKLMEVKA